MKKGTSYKMVEQKGRRRGFSTIERKGKSQRGRSLTEEEAGIVQSRMVPCRHKYHEEKKVSKIPRPRKVHDTRLRGKWTGERKISTLSHGKAHAGGKGRREQTLSSLPCFPPGNLPQEEGRKKGCSVKSRKDTLTPHEGFSLLGVTRGEGPPGDLKSFPWWGSASLWKKGGGRLGIAFCSRKKVAVVTERVAVQNVIRLSKKRGGGGSCGVRRGRHLVVVGEKKNTYRKFDREGRSSTNCTCRPPSTL